MTNLEELFWRARQLESPAARHRFLDQLAAESPEIVDDLRKMLEFDETSRHFMVLREERSEGEPTRMARWGDRDHACAAVGRSPEFDSLPRERQIGPYRLLRRIGEGGMGIVYLAQQEQPVRRRVAVKIIRPGMDSQQIVARFEVERQALAMMDHPNIARALDAGTTASGLPYFVMELVEGQNITHYCDSQRLNLTKRLLLVCELCRAIQHAHDRGVIHRDIKPSNVLVTDQDEEPIVKVIDFGVAKALEGSLTDQTVLTGMFQVAGTPLYMSPEQADLHSEPQIDVRSDVYSLGVLLYELLVSTPPIDRQEARKLGVDELRRRICDQPPQRPSQRLAALEQDLERIAHQRRTTPKQLVRSISRELDWVVMRAIEQDRQRRYQSPRELADDLQRLLRGEAVQACPPSLSYVLSKSFRRHRVLISSVALVTFALVLGSVVAMVQAVRAGRAEQRAENNYALMQQHAMRLTRLLYANDLTTAVDHYRDGNMPQLRQKLQRHLPPGPDDPDLRGFEWYLLDNLREIPTRCIYQTDGRADALQLSPDTGTLVAGDSTGLIALLDTQNWSVAERYDSGQGEVRDCVFLSDRRFATCGSDGSVAIWERGGAGDGKVELLQRIEVSNLELFAVAGAGEQQKLFVAGDDRRVYQVSLGDGSSRPICTPLDQRIECLQWLDTGTLFVGLNSGTTATFDQPNNHGVNSHADWLYRDTITMDGVRDLSYSPLSGLVTQVQLNGLVTVFDATAAHQVRLNQLLPVDLHSVALSHDGRWLAAGDAGGNLHLMPTKVSLRDSYLDSDTARDRRRRTWRAHGRKVERVLLLEPAATGQSLQLLSAARDGTVMLSRPLSQMGHRHVELPDITDFACLEGGQVIVTGGDVSLRQLGDQLPAVATLRDSGPWSGLQLTGERRTLYLMRDRRSLWRASRGARPDSWNNDVEIWKAPANQFAANWSVSPDDQWLALNLQNEQPRSHRLQFYRSGATAPHMDVVTNRANAMQFSPDSRYLAVVRNDNIQLWDVMKGQQLSTLSHHGDAIRDLAFSPDGRYLASVSNDRHVAFWDVREGQLLWWATAHENRAQAVAFHPWLPTLVTAGADAMLHFWRLDARDEPGETRLVGKFPLDTASPIKLAFTPDGRQLVVQHAGAGLTVLGSSL